MFKTLMKYIGYFMGIVSAIAFVGGTAWAVSSWVGKQEDIANETGDLKIIVKNMDTKLDSIAVRQMRYNRKVDNYAAAHNALQKSVILYWRDNLTKTDSFMKYFEGLKMENYELKKNNEPSSLMIPYIPR
jgi:hypothetical protein